MRIWTQYMLAWKVLKTSIRQILEIFVGTLEFEINIGNKGLRTGWTTFKNREVLLFNYSNLRSEFEELHHVEYHAMHGFEDILSPVQNKMMEDAATKDMLELGFIENIY